MINSSGNVVFSEAPDEGSTIDITYFKPSYNSIDPEDNIVVNSITSSNISNSRSGSVTMSSGLGSSIINFSNLGLTNLPDNDYRIILSSNGSVPVYWNDKSTTGFEINRASSNSLQVVDWAVFS